jgi:hypothetical protein
MNKQDTSMPFLFWYFRFGKINHTFNILELKKKEHVKLKGIKNTLNNNVPPNESSYRLFDFNEMVMRSPCWEAWEKYNGDGHA